MTMFDIIFGAKGTATTATENDSLADLFDNTEDNVQRIGEMEIASIPLKLCEIDPSYQRVETYTESAVNNIAAHWDNTKVGLPKVSRHPEEKRYYVIDGMHRLFAARKIGKKNLTCEIVTLSNNPMERRKQEATLFIGQIEVDIMKPMDQHKAKVMMGIPEYVEVDDIIKNTDGVEFKTRNGKGLGKPTHLTGYKEFVRLCKGRGKEHCQDVLDALIGAGWNMFGNGLGNRPLRMVSNVLFMHKGDEVKAEIARILRNYEVNLFLSKARGEYPECKPTQAATLYLEDYVCTNLNIPRLIDPEVTERFTPEVA